MNKLVIIPCTKRKIWKHIPTFGSTPAIAAYTGALFRLSKLYAYAIQADAVYILSAKYGLVHPFYNIAGPYDTRLTKLDEEFIDKLWINVRAEGLLKANQVIGVGGKHYLDVLRAAFPAEKLIFPFEGLTIGKLLSKLIQSIEEVDTMRRCNVNTVCMGVKAYWRMDYVDQLPVFTRIDDNTVIKGKTVPVCCNACKEEIERRVKNQRRAS